MDKFTHQVHQANTSLARSREELTNSTLFDNIEDNNEVIFELSDMYESKWGDDKDRGYGLGNQIVDIWRKRVLRPDKLEHGPVIVAWALSIEAATRKDVAEQMIGEHHDAIECVITKFKTAADRTASAMEMVEIF